MAWMRSLNSQVDVNFEDPNSVSRLKSDDFFELVFMLTTYPELYDFGDDKYCLFADFPYNRLVVPVFYYREFNALNFVLPCSCNIYNMFKYYPIYSNLTKQITGENALISNEKYLPVR